jgi:hypothetical protein
MCVVDVDCPFDNGLTSVNTVIPTPLFGRYSAAEGRRLAVYVVACDEDLRSIGSLPTFNDAINWRIVRADQSVETDTLIKLVIWDASFAANLPISLDDRQQTGPSLIAYRTPDTPPHLLKGRPTSRLCFQGSINSLLRRLAYSLIIPEAYEGLICVAYEDVAKAVSR